MAQIFGSALERPWALVCWGGFQPGQRPRATVVYLTDDCGDHYEGGLVEFYRKRATLKAVRDLSGKIIRYDTKEPGDTCQRWHFRFKRSKTIRKSEVLHIFPNWKSRDAGPSQAQVKAAKRALSKTEATL